MVGEKREKDIEKILREGVKKLGGIAYKFVSPGNNGVPDRIVIMPSSKIFFVELKTINGKLSKTQMAQIRRLESLGQRTKVVYGEEEVRELLEELKNES